MNNKFVNAVLIWKDKKPALTFQAKYAIWYEPTWKGEHIEDLKSNDYVGVTKNIKELFVENLEARILNLKKQGKIPVVVLPPRKSGQSQSMQFVKTRLNELCYFVSISSPPYEKLHQNQKSKTEREQVINTVMENWELSATIFEKNTHFIFVDDMFTNGSTTMGVIKKFSSLNKSPIKQWGSALIAPKIMNFEGMYLTRRKLENENIHVQYEGMSKEINREARVDNITCEYIRTL